MNTGLKEKNTRKSDLLRMSILFFFVLWFYRIYKINSIILYGRLADFHKLFFAAKEILLNGDSRFIATSSYGPPFIYVPYFPLTPLPFQAAEYVITILSLISYFLVFYLLWKKHYSKTNSYFWVFLGILAFSFPIIYSLGMGNPIGIVLLGVYGIFIHRKKIISGVLYATVSMMKLFPLVILPFLLIDKLRKKVSIKNNSFKDFLISFAVTTLAILVVVPRNIYLRYFEYIFSILGRTTTSVDTTAYNQSFSSGITRLGITIYSFSTVYWIFFILISSVLTYRLFYYIRNNKQFDLEFYLFLIAFTLLIHPFPWQYYFAIFIPFLMIKIYKKQFFYLLVFLLLSIDGNRFHTKPFIDNFMMGSQFFGTILLYFFIGLRPIWNNIFNIDKLSLQKK